ncbi:MAG: flagellar hook assembly protein FlgD [Deltaproteobacteria bacterium]|nr:flagellar hook assembly protein FlgD [Deltaproteobacteria bacterium]
MVINGTAAPGTVAPQSQAAKSAQGALGKDDFLKLLVAQLKNQDPLNPTDNTQFVAQLAQFSSLEGITNLNKSMEGISSSMSALQNSNAANLIGKSVKAEGSDFSYSGSPVTVGYDLTGAASSVKVSVFDAAGRLMRTIEGAAQPSGVHDSVWDGKDMNNNPSQPGSYSFTVTARDSANNAVSANTYVYGRVSGVNFDSGKANLLVDGKEISQNKLKGIYR